MLSAVLGSTALIGTSAEVGAWVTWTCPGERTWVADPTVHLLAALATCLVPLWPCRTTPVSPLDLRAQVPLSRVDAINPSCECLTGREELRQESCEDRSLLHATWFWVGHPVTHNLIKINGASKAFRVT